MAATRSTASQARWESLLDALMADRDVLVPRIRDEIQAQLDSYRHVPADDLTAGIGLEVECAIRAARLGPERISESELADVAQVGAKRADQGMPIAQMLLAWRIGVQVVLGHGRELAAGLGIEPAQMLEFVQAILASSDRAMAIVAHAHQRAQLALAQEEHEGRTRLVTGVLLGTLAPAEARAQAEGRAIEPDAQYVAIRAQLPEGGARIELERALGFHEVTHPRPGLSAVVGGDLAGFLRAAPGGDIPFAVGLGPPRSLEGLAESFQLATRAVGTARAFRLVGVHTVERLGVLTFVAGEPAAGDAFCQRYLDPLAGSAAEIAASLRAYFDCEMQVERAAERLFVHPNTLRYRIARFEELTASNLRDPRTAFEVWWALQRHHIRGAQPEPAAKASRSSAPQVTA